MTSSPRPNVPMPVTLSCACSSVSSPGRRPPFLTSDSGTFLKAHSGKIVLENYTDRGAIAILTLPAEHALVPAI